LAHTLAIAISNAVSGMTSRCSSVPCSRSRITAAPVSTTVSRLIWLMIATTLLNQAEIAFGLNSFRITSWIGFWGETSVRFRYDDTRSLTMFLM
jgi:hypothetical protein